MKKSDKNVLYLFSSNFSTAFSVMILKVKQILLKLGLVAQLFLFSIQNIFNSLFYFTLKSYIYTLTFKTSIMSNTLHPTIDDAYRHLIDIQDIPKTEIAKLAGISPQTLSVLLKRGSISLASLKKISEALGYNCEICLTKKTF